MKLSLLDASERCDVKAVYGPTELEEGTYIININNESDDWYEIIGTDIYIKTFSCLNLSLMDEAILRVFGANSGEIIFEDDDKCTVEGFYTRLKL